MKPLLVAGLCALVLLVPAGARSGGLPACLAHNLIGRAAFEGGAGAQEGGVVLRNVSGHSCVLSGRSTVGFAAGGKQLDVYVAVGRATDGRRRDRTIVLRPKQRAFVHVRWSNWCGERFDRVTVRLWLRSVEPLVRVRGAVSPPRCDDASTPSRVAIGPYERVRIYRP